MRRAALQAFAVGLALASPAAHAADATPPRVATLLPWVEDALRATGDPALVVAAARRDPRHAPAGAVDLGSPHEPNLERLAASGAQLVIGDAHLHRVLEERLRRAGAEVMLVEATGVDATFDALRAIGERVGRGAAMAALVDEARRDLAAVSASRPASVLPVFGTPGSFRVITARAWLGDLVARVGLRNLAADVMPRSGSPGYVEISDEWLAAQRPDLAVLVVHGDPTAVRAAFEKRLVDRGVLAPGGSPSRVAVLDPELFGSNPGLRIPAAARALVALGASAEPVASGPPAGHEAR